MEGTRLICIVESLISTYTIVSKIVCPEEGGPIDAAKREQFFLKVLKGTVIIIDIFYYTSRNAVVIFFVVLFN